MARQATAGHSLRGVARELRLVLLAVALVAFGVAALVFERRNLTVGAWPWQRGNLPAGDRESSAA